MRDVALHMYSMSHTILNHPRLNAVADCAAQLSSYFNDVLTMTNPMIAREDATAAKDALAQWLNMFQGEGFRHSENLHYW